MFFRNEEPGKPQPTGKAIHQGYCTGAQVKPETGREGAPSGLLYRSVVVTYKK